MTKRKLVQPGPREARDCVCYNLRKAARAVTQLYDEMLRPTGIRGTQYTLLAALRNLGSASISELAERTVTDRTTLTRNLRLLEERGLIRIEPGEDRRVREARLTDAGREALAEAYPYWRRAQDRMAESLTVTRMRRLLSDLSETVEAAQAQMT